MNEPITIQLSKMTYDSQGNGHITPEWSRWQVRQSRIRDARYPLYSDKTDGSKVVGEGTAEQYVAQTKEQRGVSINICPILKEPLQEYVAQQVKETVLLGFGYTKEAAEKMAAGRKA